MSILLNSPVDALRQYVEFPSVSADSKFANGVIGARDFACDRLKELGFDVNLISTPIHPIILGTRGDPSWPRLVIYGHYDVQPPDPLDLWSSDPFIAVERDGRLYGRGAADNKGPQVVHMAALARVLRDIPDYPLHITYLIEGEEEIGSPSFRGFLEDHKSKLQGDLLLVSDTGSPGPEQLVVTTGLRGLSALEVKVFGPKQDLHSGVHGGALLNPLQALMHVCASLHDNDGRVTVPGFYDAVRPPEQWERYELSKLPTTEEEYARFLGVADFFPPPGYSSLEAIRFCPTLEFNGVGGGYQGEGSKTVIPAEAFAKITCRLVPDQKSDDIAEKVKKAIIQACPDAVRVEVDIKGGGDPYVVIPPGMPGSTGNETELMKKAFRIAEECIDRGFGSKPIFLREGGSIPIIQDLKEVAGLDSLMIGLFTNEDNLHAPDESFHLGIMERAISSFEAFFKELVGD
ncbi:MAG: M20/M25/M40 family metallo-hydrolase [Opitutae bacterium]|jgi:acetylornithine deacetylase/succinyl-diaminopimelate desuccinylase-like protein|nr:M20/M25/M40 family metallo-hydrolase [Opitutae bacterium]MBT5717501.1 M20/M25/M40 family metallo-hydrolase [Opitutae bacterium]